MAVQEGTRARPGHLEDTSACEHISDLLARIGGKWTLLIVRALESGPLRFNALKREVGEISQKVLASTLRELEENGFVERRVTPVMPPQVEYSLTELGRDFVAPVKAFAGWVIANTGRIDAARTSFLLRTSDAA